MTDALKDTAARLAAGSQGRTEADVQSDVRKFLLDAPLELTGDEVVDVALEAQAGGGRRIDVEAGCAAIEVKKSLGSKTVFDAAVGQLAGYVKQRTEERGQRYVGVLTDGQTWVLFHLEPYGDLAEVGRLELKGGEDAARLASWLETVLATTDKIKPTPQAIADRLGAASPAAHLDLADLRALYAACRDDPEVRLKRELWARLLLSALGTKFENSDELFVTHTYLVLTAELLAHEIMGLSVGHEEDVRELLEGQHFDLAGLHGVVEADFFDWPAAAPAGAPIIRAIARRLSRFDWSQVEHDVLKVLYESVIDAETRKRLGEYYTPDWLAQRTVERLFDKPLEQRLLDPSCGSGTFLFWAVRRLLNACDQAGLSNREALSRVVAQVNGIDLHPVAVTLARVTYLLALTPARLADREELTVPVFLGDSVRWEQDDTLLSKGGITVHTSDGLELFEQELHFPEPVVEDPMRFDRLVAALAARAAKERRRGEIPPINAIMNSHGVTGEDDRATVQATFEKLCRLHDAGRDHLWSYYIRNLARPLTFMREGGRADVLVGNPPWLSYRFMRESLQRTYEELAKPRGLWGGAAVRPQQDLADLFVARAVEQYLARGGRFAFVMPYAALSRMAYAGFRTGDWSSQSEATFAAFDEPEDYERVQPTLFPVPCCVVSGIKSDEAKPLPLRSTAWEGTVSGHNIDWPTAQAQLTAGSREIKVITGVGQSPYRRCFNNGATLFPRPFISVQEVPAGPLGVAAGKVAIRSSRSANEHKPWKELPDMEGVVERQFVYPVHRGSTIVPYLARTPELALIPWLGDQLLDGQDEAIDEYPGLADWWRRAERTYNRLKDESTKLTLRERIDYQRGIQRQMTPTGHRVVYTKSGTRLTACRLEHANAVIDQSLIWADVESVDEARYLTAILNSESLGEAVAPFQSVGQFGRRDFTLQVFEVPFPLFNPNDDVHQRLATLAARAEEVATATELNPSWGFQKARKTVRQALRDDGVATDIEEAVGALLAEVEETLDPGSVLPGDAEAAIPVSA